MVLHKALKQAVRWSLVPRNVAVTVIPPKPGKEEMHPLSADEAKGLFRGAREGEDRLEAIYVLAVTTGMRQGELLGLKWGDVDLDREVLQVRRTLVKNDGRLGLGEPKTKKSRRTVHLTGRGSSEVTPQGAGGREAGPPGPVAEQRPRVRHQDRNPDQPYQPEAALLRSAAGESRAS